MKIQITIRPAELDQVTRQMITVLAMTDWISTDPIVVDAAMTGTTFESLERYFLGIDRREDGRKVLAALRKTSNITGFTRPGPRQ